jgi:hypothetical protein
MHEDTTNHILIRRPGSRHWSTQETVLTNSNSCLHGMHYTPETISIQCNGPAHWPLQTLCSHIKGCTTYGESISWLLLHTHKLGDNQKPPNLANKANSEVVRYGLLQLVSSLCSSCLDRLWSHGFGSQSAPGLLCCWQILAWYVYVLHQREDDRIMMFYSKT